MGMMTRLVLLISLRSLSPSVVCLLILHAVFLFSFFNPFLYSFVFIYFFPVISSILLHFLFPCHFLLSSLYLVYFTSFHFPIRLCISSLVLLFQSLFMPSFSLSPPSPSLPFSFPQFRAFPYCLSLPPIPLRPSMTLALATRFWTLSKD